MPTRSNGQSHRDAWPGDMPYLPDRRICLAFLAQASDSQELARGVKAYSDEAGPWDLWESFTAIFHGGPVRQVYATARGIITNLPTLHSGVLDPAVEAHVPMVLIGEDVGDFPSVGPDNRAVGRLAGEHFTHLGLTSWGYCGNPGMEHSEEQFAGLREAAETVGATCSFLAPNVHACIMGFRQDYEALLAWVDSLPAPTGVLTVSTEIAHRLTVIFRNEGIDVPERIALLASGQDVLLSDLSIPRISMVDRGSRRVGYQAAAMLDRLLRGEKPEAHHVDVEPAYVISRASTDVLAVDSPRLARAIRYVRAHATEGLRVSDVIDHAGMSRRGLELGFKRNLGRTVHAEIIRVQVEEARRLLAGSELPIADISARCGFAWGTTLSSVFRRETGMTPNQYRRRYGTAGAR